MTPMWRVAWKVKAGNEQHDDYPTPGMAAARAEGLRQGGADVVIYRIDVDTEGVA